MALAIRVVPTLHGEVAKKFEAAAKKVETNPGTLDYRKQKLSRSIFKKLSCSFQRTVLQTTIVRFVAVSVFRVVPTVLQAPMVFILFTP